MLLFVISLIVLVVGYFTYGLFIDKVLKINPKAKTPAYTHNDGIDFMPMPTWKVYLIQFLNIAGVGPIFGAIMGVQYGPAAFLWIVLGTILAGGVHDFVSGMLSVRADGRSLPDLVGIELGKVAQYALTAFSLVLLIMVVAVFVTTPAGLMESLVPAVGRTWWIWIIFLYYVLATLLPIDKIIGNLYPLFGAALLFMALGLMGYMLLGGVEIPTGIEEGLFNRKADAALNPIFPMMFVSIACGAISGFHATQSPMMARCLRSESHGRIVFYGAMVTEGVVALIWAAAAITYFGGYEALNNFFASDPVNNTAGSVVKMVCDSWLGTVGGILAILGVIAAPITTGDTAMRSARLIVADALGIKQSTFVRRLLVALPIIVVSYLLMNIDFAVLWRYFGWSNQTLSIFTLWACTVYLCRHGRPYWVTLLPALFMTVVCTSYICYAPMGTPQPGIGLSYNLSVGVGIALAAIMLVVFARFVACMRKKRVLQNTIMCS